LLDLLFGGPVGRQAIQGMQRMERFTALKNVEG
jgi:hypothetical protein